MESLIVAECRGEHFDEDLEALLLLRLDSGPGIELTPEYRKQLLYK
jgi:hypothetical protein